jgi:hypothetical protein
LACEAVEAEQGIVSTATGRPAAEIFRFDALVVVVATDAGVLRAIAASVHSVASSDAGPRNFDHRAALCPGRKIGY